MNGAGRSTKMIAKDTKKTRKGRGQCILPKK